MPVLDLQVVGRRVGGRQPKQGAARGGRGGKVDVDSWFDSMHAAYGAR